MNPYHISVFFLLNHHHLIYRYNHHICVSGAFVLVDGWKTLLAQTLPWTVQRCPQVTVTVPPHSTHFMQLEQPGQYRPQNPLQISRCTVTKCTCINNAHGFTLADLHYCGVSPNMDMSCMDLPWSSNKELDRWLPSD